MRRRPRTPPLDSRAGYGALPGLELRVHLVKLALRTHPAEVFAALRALAAAPALFAALLIQDAAGLGRQLRDRRVHVVGLVVGASLVAGFLALSTVGLERRGSVSASC